MFELVIGIAVGAAFSPFWMMVWTAIKTKYTEFMAKK